MTTPDEIRARLRSLPSGADPEAAPPPGVKVEALAGGGVRVVFWRPSPLGVGTTVLLLVLGLAILNLRNPSHGPFVRELVRGDRGELGVLGGILTGIGLLVGGMYVGHLFFASSREARPGRLDLYRGVFRRRLIASIGEGPLEVTRHPGDGDGPGGLTLEVRTPFLGTPIVICGGESFAPRMARFLAKETGFPASVSNDAGTRR